MERAKHVFAYDLQQIQPARWSFLVCVHDSQQRLSTSLENAQGDVYAEECCQQQYK